MLWDGFADKMEEKCRDHKMALWYARILAQEDFETVRDVFDKFGNWWASEAVGECGKNFDNLDQKLTDLPYYTVVEDRLVCRIYNQWVARMRHRADEAAEKARDEFLKKRGVTRLLEIE